jgi:hypothetical protein
MFSSSWPNIDSFAHAIACDILDVPKLFTSQMVDIILGGIFVHFSRVFLFLFLRKPIQKSLYSLFNVQLNRCKLLNHKHDYSYVSSFFFLLLH